MRFLVGAFAFHSAANSVADNGPIEIHESAQAINPSFVNPDHTPFAAVRKRRGPPFTALTEGTLAWLRRMWRAVVETQLLDAPGAFDCANAICAPGQGSPKLSFDLSKVWRSCVESSGHALALPVIDLDQPEANFHRAFAAKQFPRHSQKP